MNKQGSILIWILAILILIILAGGILFFVNLNNGDIIGTSNCEIKELRETLVSLELAKSVGENYIPKYYPEFEWMCIGSYDIYNSFGDIKYYVLIFRKSEFMNLNTLEKLEQNAKLFSYSAEDYNELNNEQKQVNDEQRYQFNNTATIITGSMKEDKLIQNHFRGISEAIGKRLEIKEFVENKYLGRTIGNLVSDSPMGQVYYEIVEKDSLEKSGDLIKIRDYSIISNSDLIKIQEDIQERKQKKNSGYDKEMCEFLKKAIIEAREAHIAEWNKF